MHCFDLLPLTWRPSNESAEAAAECEALRAILEDSDREQAAASEWRGPMRSISVRCLAATGTGRLVKRCRLIFVGLRRMR